MLGQTLGHYEILEKIASGGKGEVYLANDTELDRKVALKVLPPDLAESEERRERFKREAKAIAALNHPNIVTIYSVEEAESPQPERSAERSGVAEREAVGVGPHGIERGPDEVASLRLPRCCFTPGLRERGASARGDSSLSTGS